MEKGFEETLNGSPRLTPPTEKLLDGEQETRIIALRSRAPPKRYANWSLRLLSRKVVEIEFSALTRGCLHRCIPTLEQLAREVLALVNKRHQKRIEITWQFSIETVHGKFQPHYHAIRADDETQQCKKTQSTE